MAGDQMGGWIDLGGATPKLGEGNERTVPAAETVARLQPFLRPLGITRVANVTGMDTIGIPTVIVTRPNSRSLSVSQGKGMDLNAARASALMESVEQWHAERIDRPLRLGSASELGPRLPLVNVARLPRFVVPFDEHARMLWIEGVDLISAGSCWVPHEMVHLDLRLPLPPGGHFPIGSNGLASGNHPLEATVHGLCELIERDAASLFYLRSVHDQWHCRIDNESVDDANCRDLLRAYEDAGVDVAIWDTTSDVGVPSYLVSILDKDPNPFRPVGLARGGGCHPNPAVALSRALTEAAQSRLTRIVGTRDDIQAEHFAGLQSEAKLRRARAEMYTPERPRRQFAQQRGLQARTLEAELGWLCQRLRASGFDQAAVVDLSRADMDIPVAVVRIIVPGLEGTSDAPGYQPGQRARTVVDASADEGSA